MNPSIYMLIPLAVVFAIGATFYLIARWRSRRLITSDPVGELDWSPKQPLFFQNPKTWLAIKSTNPGEVEVALGLHEAAPCSWNEGIELAAEEKLFISPPVNGWVLVFGTGLPDPREDVDEFFKFIVELGRTAGLVIYFQSERALDHHAWIKVMNGRVVRAYAWADATLWNQGDLTQAERDLRLRCQPYGAAGETVSARNREAARINCERLPALAARWSIDPKSIDAQSVNQVGIAGAFSHGKPH